MKSKGMYEEYKKEFMASGTEYCCYCLEPKEEKSSCCYENHFVTFNDLYEEDQKHIINSEIELSFDGEKQ